ncbi:MAG: hypothetical protein RL702_118 [Pseudomonadota bacterium]|jgi:hypothetical protein
MRASTLAMALLLFTAGGCSREPSFDERYKGVSHSITASAQAIDAEIQATDRATAPAAPESGNSPVAAEHRFAEP